MIRSLRRKFILIAMASLVGTMVVLCTAIGIGNYCINTNRVDHAIALLRQNGGRFLPPVGCLLYTSDAADHVTGVDPGGSRIS